MLKKWVSVVFTVAYTMIGTTALAYVDDAGVMDYFNYNNDQYLYDYFNNNDYRFYNKSQKADAYIKNDNSLFMTISNNSLEGLWRQAGMLYQIVIMKPGYKTDKGIEVGMTLNQVKTAYGELCTSGQTDVYRNEPHTGYYLEGVYNYKKNSTWSPSRLEDNRKGPGHQGASLQDSSLTAGTFPVFMCPSKASLPEGGGFDGHYHCTADIVHGGVLRKYCAG